MGDVLGMFENNVLLLGRVCFQQMCYLPTPQFHKDLAAVYHNKRYNKINIIAPRGHAKSSVMAGVVPLHHIFCDHSIPGPKVVVLVSKTQGHAIRLLDTIKMTLNYSEKFRQLFGYHGQMNAVMWTNHTIILDTGDVITTRGTGQMIVGMKFGNQRPTLIILDDPEDTENTKTIEAMQNNLKWLLTALVPSRDSHTGRVIVIGTPQHQGSMVMTLKRMAGWKTLHYQALADEVMENTQLREDILAGRVIPNPSWALWPEQWSVRKLLEEYNSLESIGKASFFYREYQCKIVGDTEQTFRPEDIRNWTGRIIVNPFGQASVQIYTIDGHKPEHEDIRPVNIYTGVDPASSLSTRADRSVIMNVAVDPMANRFVLPYFCKRTDPLTLATKIFDNYLTYKPVTTRIESTGYQEMLRLHVREESLKRGFVIPGLEIPEKPNLKKKGEGGRLDSLQPFFRRHQVFLIEGQMQELRDELLIYPRGRHDDTLDGLYLAMKGNHPPSHDTEDAPKGETEEAVLNEEDDFLLW